MFEESYSGELMTQQEATAVLQAGEEEDLISVRGYGSDKEGIEWER